MLDELSELWDELRLYQLERSTDFKWHYESFTFHDRKKPLLLCADRGKLFIVIAYHDGVKIGYCISSVVDGVGEIESIYVKTDYRKQNIGNGLMSKSIEWIKTYDVRKVMVKVVTGNEDAMGFYSRFGFKPRFTDMQLTFGR